MKKRGIKIFSFFLAALLLLTACSAGSGSRIEPEQSALQNTAVSQPQLDPKKPVNLEIWHYYNGVQKTAFDHMVQGFNETIGLEKGIIVEAFSQGNISDLTEKVVDAANKKVGAEDIPDIFAAYADTAYVVNQLGLVAELDRYLTEEELNEYRSEYLEEGRFDKNGALKIFPTAKSAEVMILNSTDWKPFAQATGVQLSDLETMEGVAEVGRQYYEWTDSLTGTPNDGKAFWGREQWPIISLSAVNNWDWKSFLCGMEK